MTNQSTTTYRLKCMLQSDSGLRSLMEQSLERAAVQNPDVQTNPVRTIEELYEFLDIFHTSMPWQAVERFLKEKKNIEKEKSASLFRRIDQTIGYFYYLFDQPLDELREKDLPYPVMQYLPQIAQWILEYNTMWGLFLSSPKSWNYGYLTDVESDPLFGLQSGLYESAENWHSWNDFFTRRLSSPSVRPIADSWLVSPCDGVLMPWRQIDAENKIAAEQDEGISVKTSTVLSIDRLLPEEFRDSFRGGLMTHVVLDMYNYHHFHSPVDGTVIGNYKMIEHAAVSGGHIIWDGRQHRYRYETLDNLGFQMFEPRRVIVFDTKAMGKVAMVAVGVEQVANIQTNSSAYLGSEVRRGDDLGCFLCGGSDVLIIVNKDADNGKEQNNRKTIFLGESLI